MFTSYEWISVSDPDVASQNVHTRLEDLPQQFPIVFQYRIDRESTEYIRVFGTGERLDIQQHGSNDAASQSDDHTLNFKVTVNGFKRVMMDNHEGAPMTFEQVEMTPLATPVEYHISDNTIAGLKTQFERDVIQPVIALLNMSSS
jgi:hypothetical protein